VSGFDGLVDANSNAAATSPDGINWTARTLAKSLAWTGIAWNGSQFCAVAVSRSGPGTEICNTSSDGITWTQRTIPVAGYTRGISFDGFSFGVLSYGNTGDGGKSRLFTSTDGVSWDTLIPGTDFQGIGTNQSGKFVLVGYNGIAIIAGAVSIITSSADGANGSISPLGETIVIDGEDQSYTITMNQGYYAAVLVDGVSVGNVSLYTFSNVTTDHTISVTFSQIQISPSGSGVTSNRKSTGEIVGLLVLLKLHDFVQELEALELSERRKEPFQPLQVKQEKPQPQRAPQIAAPIQKEPKPQPQPDKSKQKEDYLIGLGVLALAALVGSQLGEDK
jgi:hypothetical protein